MLDAIASPRRREILRLIWNEEQTAGAIHRSMPDVTFGAVSLQLRSLVEAGLVEARAQQRNRFYRARREALVTHVDARLPTGEDIDRASCIAALVRRKEAR